MLPTIASQVNHCRPVRVVSGTVASTWVSWARRGVGTTVRGSTRAAGADCSRKSTSAPRRGWS
ncbi:Uncharacterised protein [Mycobacteroides abscessus subsp. abscessus]|nr:Uncharacterised protein [Mycobacteroides abscessus subsp. abscessus]